MLPPKGLGEDLSLPLLASDGGQKSLGSPGLWFYQHMAFFPLCVCVSPTCLFLVRTPAIRFRAHPATAVGPHHTLTPSATPLLSNKISFTGARVGTSTFIFSEGHRSTDNYDSLNIFYESGIVLGVLSLESCFRVPTTLLVAILSS